jgi:hypothetical protein
MLKTVGVGVVGGTPGVVCVIVDEPQRVESADNRAMASMTSNLRLTVARVRTAISDHTGARVDEDHPIHDAGGYCGGHSLSLMSQPRA